MNERERGTERGSGENVCDREGVERMCVTERGWRGCG